MRTALRPVTLSAALVAALAGSGAQAQSVDVKVTGQIVPAACAIDISEGGVFNYGNIQASTLDRDNYTKLPIKSGSLSVTCDARAKVGVQAIDNRSSSQEPGQMPSDLGNQTTGANDSYGLGRASGVSVGRYAIQLERSTFTADGQPSTFLLGRPDGTWTGQINSNLLRPNWRFSWGGSSYSSSIAATTFSVDFLLQATLNRSNRLPLTGTVPLDGLATLELIYL